MIKNAALFLVLVGLFVGIAIYSHKRTQDLQQSAPATATATEQEMITTVAETTEEAAIETVETAEAVTENEETQTVPTKSTKPAPKNFASDIEALEAYHLCRQHEYDLQACVDKLADYHSRGFVIQAPEREAEPYLTLPLADDSKISIHYQTANVLLGDAAELKKAAETGVLGDEMKKLFASEITLLTPNE